MLSLGPSLDRNPARYGYVAPQGNPLYMNTGNNFGIANFGNPDARMITGNIHGTPWYQATNANVQFDPEVQRVMEKERRWQAMPWQERVYKAHNPDYWVSNEEKIRAMQKNRQLTYEQEKDFKRFMLEQIQARGRAFMDTNPNMGFGLPNDHLVGSMMANNTHISNLVNLNPFSRVALPEGNQLGRMLQAAAHRGVTPPDWLTDYANRQDKFADWWNPSGQWQALSMQSGSKMGLGGMGSGSFARSVYQPEQGRMAEGSNWVGRNQADTGRMHGPQLPPSFRNSGGHGGNTLGGPHRGVMPYQPYGGGDRGWGSGQNLEERYRNPFLGESGGGRRDSGPSSPFVDRTRYDGRDGSYRPGRGTDNPNQLGGRFYPDGVPPKTNDFGQVTWNPDGTTSRSSHPLWGLPDGVLTPMEAPSHYVIRTGGKTPKGFDVANGLNDVFSGFRATSHYKPKPFGLATGFNAGQIMYGKPGQWIPKGGF